MSTPPQDPYSSARYPYEYGAQSAHDRSGGQDSNPTCPRHPDRVSYIRCQRCEQPTCTECQRRAAVGVQCVQCVSEAQAAQRASAPRTAVGAQHSVATPIITYTIMGMCAVVYAAQFLGFDVLLSRLLMFVPVNSLAMPWTFITSGFMHGSIPHLVLNLYALYAVGMYLERQLGYVRYAAVFLLSVIGGHVAVLLLASAFSDAFFTGTVGASGGLFGLFGALLIVQRRMGGESAQVMVLIALNFAIGFIYPNISWQGHLGGLVTGAALAGLLFASRPKRVPGVDRAALIRKANVMHGLVFAGVFIVLVVLVGVKWGLLLGV